MIYGFLHPGSGLGNMLHRYVATRCLALKKGYDFSMIGKENFKGKDFMNIDMGKENNLITVTQYPAGKLVVAGKPNLWEEKTNYYNPEFNFIEDNTIIDGEFQDERYWKDFTYGFINQVDEWLKVEPLKIPDDTCVIGFRGGEFSVFPELFLPKEYWDEAIQIMKDKGITKFEVHTDDEILAKQFFPDYPVIHDIAINWRSMRYARYAIIANSSFYILPRWLRRGFTIAPRYWARHNTKEWSMPQNYYSRFKYI